MSGHSKWSTIKRQKAVTDSRRSVIFTKLARFITVAARAGGGDQEMNFSLRLAIEKARTANMPNDNIDRAIQAGTGESRGEISKEAVYEGFGPGQVAIMVDVLTDNPNRTSAEIRQIFQRHDGALGTQNTVGWMFDLRGVIRIPRTSIVDIDAFLLSAIDAGVEDSQEEGEELILLSAPTTLHSVQQWLQGQHLSVLSATLERLPRTTIALDSEDEKKLHHLLDDLDDHPDVSGVSSNERA